MTSFKSNKYEHYKNSGTKWLGVIPSHWEIRRVKDEFISLDYKRIPLSGEERQTMTEPQYDYYGASGVIDKVDNYIFDEPLILIGEDGANLLMRGSALAFIARGKYWVNNHAHVLKPRKGNLDYLCYLLETFDYTPLVSGSAQPKLTAGELENVLLMIPPLPEQQVIADYLNTKIAQIDRNIELLAQKAEKYAELRQSLINETIMRGLDKAVLMKESDIEGIGQIPMHWNVYRIKDYTYVKGRIGWQGLRNSDFLDQGEFYCVTGTDLVNGSIDWSSCYYVSQERYDQDKFIQLRLGDLLITKDGTIGKVALVNELPLNTTLNSGVFVTRPLRNKYINEFMYWVVNSCVFKNFIDLTKGGSTIQHLYQNMFDRFIYVCPPLAEQKSIVAYLDKKTSEIDTIIRNINTQVEKFKELRKTLINDVVTGKIKVYEV